MQAPLEGLKVVEMAGLGPAPFACYLLAGLGADVIRIESTRPPPAFMPRDPRTNPEVMLRDIRKLDLKSDDERDAAIALIREADVLVEGFRPGVMERLGLGPEAMLAVNPRLIYARMTGYGQTGPMSGSAGHDLNYISLSGILSMIGRKDQKPTPPLNLVGDYGGGGMMLVTGVLSALFARGRTGEGQVLDISMVEGSAFLASPIFAFMAAGSWQGGVRGSNLLDSGCPFYETYATADGGYVAVASLEPKFFTALIDVLGLDPAWAARQYETAVWDELRELLTGIFKTRDRDAWTQAFDGVDACVTPVLTPQEAAQHPHNVERGSFLHIADHAMPGIAPKFSPPPKTS